MLGQFDHRIGQQFQRPALAPPRRIGAGGRHQQGCFLARQFARRAGSRLLGQRKFQIAFDEASLGSINRGAADSHRVRDRLVADARVRREQDLRPFHFARRVFAAAQQALKLESLRLAQLDPIPYVHRRPSMIEDC
jgi:hypothetical protein